MMDFGTGAMIATIFTLSCFTGYCVVLRVTPALHAPLMSVTNAISSVIIIAALQVTVYSAHGEFGEVTTARWLCLVAVFLTIINIVGGFMLTKRMLSMFETKKKKPGND
ncbi:MAG: NAD(P) transhydrogenase subunit alpha [Holosporales bacterium]|jgi:NAD(P) transhydrogenase subunit alpha|nr:NAD(P) transhydrogenase subunit alpha [Holosporales bacterium]